MHDDTIRLTAFRVSSSAYCIIASRQSDGKVELFYASPGRLEKYADALKFPDIRTMYPVHQYTVPPIVRAKVREVFDKHGADWLLPCP